MGKKPKQKPMFAPVVRPMKLTEIINPHRAQHDSFETVPTFERAHPKTDFMERAQTKRAKTQLPIDRYAERHKEGKPTGLDPLQYEAATILLADFSLAGLEPSVISRYTDMVGNGSVQDRMVKNLDAYYRWRAAMDHVGLMGWDVLYDIVCQGRDAGNEHRMYHLRQTLNALVDYYDLHPAE